MTTDFWEGFESPWEHKVPAEALYTHPSKEWQTLSDDEIKLAITQALDINVIDITKEEIEVARAIEAKLKEKNT